MNTVGHDPRILVIATDADQAELAGTALEEAHDTATVTVDSGKPVTRVRRHQTTLDCVVGLVDGEDGDEMAWITDMCESTADIPCIIVGAPKQSSAALDAGATDFLVHTQGEDRWNILANRVDNAVEHYRTQQRLHWHREIQTSYDIAFLVTGQGIIRELISAEYEDIGVDLTELYGTKIHEWIHPHDEEHMREQVHTLQHHATDEIELRFRFGIPERSWVHLEGTATTAPEANGIVIAASESHDPNHVESTLEAVIESSPAGVLIMRDGCNTVTCNRRFRELWDLPASMPTADGIHPLIETILGQVEQPDRVRDEIISLCDNPGQERHDQVRLQDGRVFEWFSLPLPMGEGRQARVWYVREFTDIAQQQDQLERYETILEAIGDPVYALDEQGRCRFVNDAYIEHSGRDRDELIGTAVAELREPAEVQKVQEMIEELLASDTRSKGTVEIERDRPAENSRRVENHIALLPPDEDGSYRGSAGVLRDITERVERERTLEQYRSLVNAMTDPACIYDMSGRFALVNETLAEWYEQSPEEIIGNHSLMLEGIRQQYEGDPFEELLAGGREELRGEFEPALDGAGTNVVEYRLTPLMIDDECQGAVAVSRDISDRKAQERELRETRTVLQTVVDNLPAGVLVQDSGGTINLANGTLVEILDIPQSTEDFIGEDRATFVDDVKHVFEQPDVFADRFRTTFDRDTPFRHEEWRLVDGRTLELDFIPYTLAGSPASLWIFREITNRKERERELEEQNERLEEFASFVSHDLRNPLNVAQGRLELASEHVENEHLSDVARAHDRIEALIDDLLLMAREGGTDVRETIGLAELVDSCWQTVATGEATCIVQSDQSIRADAARLRQLLENLIRNAVEHGGPDVTITVGDLEHGFFVADDGKGVPRSNREEIFEAGYTTARDGTGLGLNIVEQVVEEHDWTIAIGESADGGAQFDIQGVDTG